MEISYRLPCFDGQGHIIGGLFIGKQDDNQLYYGFFGYLGNKSVVKNIVLQGEVNIYNPVYTDTKYTGHHYVGGLAGNCLSRTVENCKCEMLVNLSLRAMELYGRKTKVVIPTSLNSMRHQASEILEWKPSSLIRYILFPVSDCRLQRKVSISSVERKL